MFAVGIVGKDLVKIQKMTAYWMRAPSDAVKKIEARIETLQADRKETV